MQHVYVNVVVVVVLRSDDDRPYSLFTHTPHYFVQFCFGGIPLAAALCMGSWSPPHVCGEKLRPLTADLAMQRDAKEAC